MNNLLLIDSNYLGYQAYFATGDLRHDDKRTGTFYGFLRRIRSLAFMFQTNRFAFCWDSRESFRRKEFPNYKANRKKSSEELKELPKQFNDLRDDILWNMGWEDQFVQDGIEGDDLIAIIARDILDEEDMIIVSGDGDLLQCLRPGVRVYTPSTDKMQTVQSFKKEYRINPIDWVEVKALAGDTSDNIPGVVSVGTTTAIKYILEELKEGTKAYKAIVDFYDSGDLHRNCDLMQLPHPKTKLPKINGSSVMDIATFTEVCEEYGFSSFLQEEEFDKWRQVFSGRFTTDDQPSRRQGIHYPKKGRNK